MKPSIIHVPAPPHFPCWAGCKYFTGFRGQTWPNRDSQDGARGSFTPFQRLLATAWQEQTQPQAWGVRGLALPPLAGVWCGVMPSVNLYALYRLHGVAGPGGREVARWRGVQPSGVCPAVLSRWRQEEGMWRGWEAML